MNVPSQKSRHLQGRSSCGVWQRLHCCPKRQAAKLCCAWRGFLTACLAEELYLTHTHTYTRAHTHTHTHTHPHAHADTIRTHGRFCWFNLMRAFLSCLGQSDAQALSEIKPYGRQEQLRRTSHWTFVCNQRRNIASIMSPRMRTTSLVISPPVRGRIVSRLSRTIWRRPF